MACIRAVASSARSVDVSVDNLVALMQDAGTGRFIDTLLRFCKTDIGADFVSIFTHAGVGGPSLVGTATTTGPTTPRKAIGSTTPAM